MKTLAHVKIAVLIILFVAAVQADSVQSWKSGETTVTLKNGTLRVSGNGAMEDYDSLNNPWRYKNEIIRLVIEDGVTNIGKGAFNYCNKLTSVTIPSSVMSIGDGAFACCTSLTSITIPNGVATIGEETFAYCYGLTSITIPNNVTSIEKYAFFYCTALTSVVISDGVTSIGENVFFNCTSLTSITLPTSITLIGDGAFLYCRGLTSITIPTSVTSIGNWAFRECRALKSITIQNPIPPERGEYVFGGIDWENARIYVPVNSLDAYAKEWWDYFKIIYPYETGTTKSRNVGIWLALGILSALLLSTALFVIIRKSRKKQGKEKRK